MFHNQVISLCCCATVFLTLFLRLASANDQDFSLFESGEEPPVELQIDSPAFLREDIELICRYNRLIRQKLYSIKWYKDDQEFFQYSPLEKPQVRFYAAKGIRNGALPYSIQNDTIRLWLHSVTLETQGIFRCEISTDAPEFITYKDHKALEVYVLPTKSPRITGSRSSFLLKSRVDLNCTSAKSKPVSILQWFINDILAPSDYQIAYAQVNHSDGLQTRTVRLKFVVNEDHFKYGNMKLKCVAIYKKLARDNDKRHLRTTTTTTRRPAFLHPAIVKSLRPNFGANSSSSHRRASSIFAILAFTLVFAQIFTFNHLQITDS